MTDFTWSFPQSEVIKSQDGLTNVVSVVHWTLTAVDDEYTANANGVVTLDKVSNPAEFTPFENLTKDQIEGWVIASLNKRGNHPRRPSGKDNSSNTPYVDDLKMRLELQIAQDKNPPIVSMALPFN